MRCGIPLLGERVAPRCTGADSVLLVSIVGGRVTFRDRLHVAVSTPLDLLALLQQHRVDTLICGGISPDARNALTAEAVDVVDNVACSVDELSAALEAGTLQPGYGLSNGHRRVRKASTPVPAPGDDARPAPAPAIDCLRCADRVCLSGGNCLPGMIPTRDAAAGEIRRVLDAAADISLESERRLCRLAELVYFCLEMRYRRVGLAYCVDLQEPAQILSGVLRRFFEVIPVCCKVGGSLLEPSTIEDGESVVACNPIGQARLLNQAGSDINVIVGLCVGVDTVFTGASTAPVSTIFVKDRSLANNPIGAVYSEYYLRESLWQAPLPGARRASVPAAGSEA